MLNALLTAQQAIDAPDEDNLITSTSSEGMTSGVDSQCVSSLSEGNAAAGPNDVEHVSDDA